MIIFIDSEGSPIQELSAIAMDVVTGHIVDVYHHFAYCPTERDWWARRHVHGLNPLYLQHIGFESEPALVQDFRCWLRRFNVLKVIGNDARTEAEKLNLRIYDIGLPEWSVRVLHMYHKIPNVLKTQNISFNCNARCHSDYHSYYLQPTVDFKLPPNQLARVEHGYHCSLADVFELYYYYCEQFL